MMDKIIIEYDEEPDLNEPILIEGLPGVGNVGKLAAEHIIEELKAKKFASIYSKHFPPQVLIDGGGIASLVSNELYYHKFGSPGKSDIIFLVGDYQGMTPEGQYDLSNFMIELLIKNGGKLIFTLGGWGIGRIVKEPRVLGAATSPELVEEMKSLGVEFSKDEPGNGIVGASGLLLGLGAIRSMNGVCLMGETSGYFADPNSAMAVVGILAKILDVEINVSNLEEKSKELEMVTSKLDDLAEATSDIQKDDLGYIG